MNSLLSALHERQNHVLENPRKPLTLCAAVFFGWILIIPFDGVVVRELMNREGVYSSSMSLVLMGVHLLGLLTGAWGVKNLHQAWRAMASAVLICLMASLFLFLPMSVAGYPALFIMAYFSGIYVAALGQPLQAMVPSSQRFTTVVDVLIIANLLMIFVDVLTLLVHVMMGKILAITLLFVALATLWILGPAFVSSELMGKSRQNLSEIARKSAPPSLVRPFAWLCLFIILITLNSGIMYLVVTPTFAHLPLLTSFYWAIPYIAALVLLRTMPEKANRSNTLYMALAMMGLGYLIFGLLSANAVSFLLIFTLMLGALGVFDIFWWSLMASFLDYSRRPAMVLGIGLAANVMGILVGGIVGNAIHAMPEGRSEISLAAFGVIFVGLALLPVVNRELTRVFQHHIFLVGSLYPVVVPPVIDQGNHTQYETGSIKSKENPTEETPNPLMQIREKYQLTDREGEIIAYLRKGYTYRAIAKTLGITEHTIKFHTRNIYQKLGIRNKMELVRKLAVEESEV